MFADIIAEKNGRKNTLEENTIYGDNMPNSSKLTTVRSVRATDDFWQRVKKIAEKNKTNSNKVIVDAVTEYCAKVEDENRSK